MRLVVTGVSWSCNMIVSGLLYTVLFISCNGQLEGVMSLQNLFGNAVIKNPLIQLGTQTTAELIADTVGLANQLPIAVARSLGSSDNWPALAINKNTVDTIDKFVTEFNLGSNNEDATLSIADLILKYGYPVEKHEVITEDGFVLSMFRIPGNGSVVFLMHGLLGSADDFIVAGPESGLAYVLAREGYDVWMGNARGNKHSRSHIHFSPSQFDFFDFSWHEIGVYDLPAMIDYILKFNGNKTIKYVGHSQGTTTFFVMASEKPEYNEKISLMVALSPVAFMSHVKSPIVRLLAPGGPLLNSITKSMGMFELFPNNKVIRTLKSLMCGVDELSIILCTNALFMIVGFDLEQLNVTNLPVILSHIPSGSSTKQFVHYGQSVISAEFRKYDYGVSENIKRYEQNLPPKYHLNRISTPVSLFYSSGDWLAHPIDVYRLSNELGNKIDMYKIPLEHFSHVDFLFSKDVKTLIHKRLLKMLKLF